MDPPRECASGGGVRFVIGFEKFLKSKGHEVIFSLDYKNLPDMLFMFDPRYLNFSKNNITIDHVRSIRQNKLPVKIIHRMNDIGPPKGRPMNYVSNMLELANYSDAVVYVSNFVKDYFSEKGNITTNNSVIYNGVDKKTFFPKDKYSLEKIKLVTHHWSTNKIKGWDFYKKIDNWIENKNIDFTIIGNIPNDIDFKNTNIVKPITGKELSEKIKESNIYITASQYEPCGNHYLEGVACGLPLLYHSQGGGVLDMNEFGEEYDNLNSFKQKLELIKNNYDMYHKRIINNFNFYHDVVFEKYYKVILGSYNDRP